jgi:Uma2 family endonuclease
MAVDVSLVEEKPRTGQPISLEELMRLPDDGNKYELVKGVLKVTPSGHEQEDVGGWLVTLLNNLVRPRKLGRVYGSNAGYRLPNGDVRAPDVSFVRQERLPGGRSPKSFADYPPDLMVEVLQPGGRLSDVAYKLGEFFDWGTPLIWVIDPAHQTVTVYRSLSDVRTLYANDTLDGGDVIPGFAVRVGELFE